MQISDFDVNAADDKVSSLSTNGISATTKPKQAGESPVDVSSVVKKTAKAKTTHAQCAGLGSAFTRSPEQIWQDPPGFYGNENYGFEWERWAKEQDEMQRLTQIKQ